MTLKERTVLPDNQRAGEEKEQVETVLVQWTCLRAVYIMEMTAQKKPVFIILNVGRDTEETTGTVLYFWSQILHLVEDKLICFV